ncbi:MAG: phospholipase A [Gammaproteobacteria bacterium]|nr:phospholipase A [Gammaproteobacteria bacterium]
MGCRVSEAIFGRDAKNLYRGRGTKKIRLILFVLTCLATSLPVFSQTKNEAVEACIAVSSRTALDDQTLGELRQQCQKQTGSLIGRRIAFENAASRNPFSILPHKPNYLLPVTYSDVNEKPYRGSLQGYRFDDIEAKFQISVKYIAVENFFIDDLGLHIAFTTTSWWQSYNSEISAPFRETNYESELIFSYKKPWSLAGLNVTHSSLSLSHQSNGQASELSRSWNRIVGSLIFSRDNVIWNLKAWWRFPEDNKKSSNDPVGDDNPDIEKYMGYGELSALWKLPKEHNIDMSLRNNLRRDNKGAIQLGWSFPFNKQLRWYVEYFNGYGESLIYYNYSVSRVGLGVKLTDWL